MWYVHKIELTGKRKRERPKRRFIDVTMSGHAGGRRDRMMIAAKMTLQRMIALSLPIPQALTITADTGRSSMSSLDERVNERAKERMLMSVS